MKTIVNMHEAKTQLSKLVAKVLAGEDVIIAKSGTPVVRIVPVHDHPKPRTPGQYAGKIHIADDFDAPLPPDCMDAFE